MDQLIHHHSIESAETVASLHCLQKSKSFDWRPLARSSLGDLELFCSLPSHAITKMRNRKIIVCSSHFQAFVRPHDRRIDVFFIQLETFE